MAYCVAWLCGRARNESPARRLEWAWSLPDGGWMFLRLLFVLLTALNIAVGAWLVLGQPYAGGGTPSDTGVPQLRLLSEMPQAASTIAAAGTAAPVGSGQVSYSCFALGPFTTPQDLRNARRTLANQAVRMRSRQEQANQTKGWWVYLPASDNRAQALELARKLAAQQIDDYFVVSSGDQANTISLGLFRDPANARKRRDAVTAAGFPAQLSERSERVPEYWLDLVVADGSDPGWRTRVQTKDVSIRAIGCF